MNMGLNERQIMTNVEEVFALYDRFGSEEYGENVSQLMHMMQSANYAAREGASDDLVIAAFLHDIGHFLETTQDMEGYGRHDHDLLGGAYLIRMGFSLRIASLVSSHVMVKRYLTYKDPSYYEQLSEASRITLKFQGGPMNAAEAREFEANPMKEEFIKIRVWDDLGKDADVPVLEEDLARMKVLISDHLKVLHLGTGIK
jgi:predicted HD phosphohydrolase